ncbi:MAG: rhomboid family intramembrane serine protease [Ferruginibacter sp.]
MIINVTLLLIVATSVVSLAAFNNQSVMDKLIFYPPAISQRNEWYRFFSCGLIHANIPHLVFNMYALYLFGTGQEYQDMNGLKHSTGVESFFIEIFGKAGYLLYFLMYAGAVGVSLLPTYGKNKENYYYRSLGASGGVSAIVFAQIALNPLQGIGLVFIPVYIAGFLFGIIYLLISWQLDKSQSKTINHSAHIWGSVFGAVYIIALCQISGKYPLLDQLAAQIRDMRLDQIITFRGN